MTIDYKALAERIRQELDKPYYTGSTTMIHKDDLRTVASLLEGMADEKPVLWMQSDHVGIASRSPFMARCAPTQLHPDFVPLFTHPAPQPPPERQPVTYETLLGAVARGWCHPENANKEMDATLAIAIADEVLAINRSEPTEAQIEAAEAKPVAWMDEFGNAFPLDAWKPAKRAGYLDYHKKAWKPLFTHPEPQPQPEQERSEQEEEG